MELTKSKLGKYLELVELKNSNNDFGLESVRGISTQKVFIDTKANMDGVPLTNYKIVPPNCFAYVPDTSRRGDKISLAFNNTRDYFLVSSISVVFKVSDDRKLNSTYLFMFFNRPEFDRYSRYHSFGSAREPFNWEDMCDIEIELPNIEIQEKYAEVYLSLAKNQLSYESGLDDLKLVCDGFIENLKKHSVCEEIGKYLELKRSKNSDDRIKIVYGVSNQLKFIRASSSVNEDNLTDYKIVNYLDIAYVPTTHMKIWAAAISNINYPFVISPIYEVLGVKNKDILWPEYLFMWLCREETIRYAFYNSWGSARENFVFEDFCSIKMPVPKIEIQKNIVNIFKVMEERKNINEQLKEQIKIICPILIKGSIEEAKRS